MNDKQKYQYAFKVDQEEEKYLDIIKKQALHKLVEELPEDKLDKLFQFEKRVDQESMYGNRTITEYKYSIEL